MKGATAATILIWCCVSVEGFAPRGIGANRHISRAAASLDEAQETRPVVADDEEVSDTPGMAQPKHRWVCPEHSNVCDETGITLSRYMREMARANPELEQIESIFTALQTATKTISSLVRRSCLTGITGLEGNINVQGEEQKKLDVITNDVLKNALEWSGHLATLASEEEDAPVMIDNRGNKVYSGDVLIEQNGDYVAVFDPLDGSSNIDASIPTGTVFGIFQNNEECLIADDDPDQVLDEDEQRCLQNTLQPGKNLVAAGYCLYSSTTILMFTIGNGVQGHA